MSADLQVQAVERIPVRESQLHSILQTYSGESNEATGSFRLRVFLCGRKAEASLSPVLESLAKEAWLKADATNPLVKEGDATENPSSVVIDYGEYLFQVIEGAERHVLSYLSELNTVSDKKEKVSDVRILFVDDDVESAVACGWLYISKVPPVSLTNDEGGKSEAETAQSITQDTAGVLELAALASNESEAKRMIFADSAKGSFPRLFPKVSTMRQYLECDVLFSLDEFVGCFCEYPDFICERETLHPPDDPLKF